MVHPPRSARLPFDKLRDHQRQIEFRVVASGEYPERSESASMYLPMVLQPAAVTRDPV